MLASFKEFSKTENQQYTQLLKSLLLSHWSSSSTPQTDKQLAKLVQKQQLKKCTDMDKY